MMFTNEQLAELSNEELIALLPPHNDSDYEEDYDLNEIIPDESNEEPEEEAVKEPIEFKIDYEYNNESIFYKRIEYVNDVYILQKGGWVNSECTINRTKENFIFYNRLNKDKYIELTDKELLYYPFPVNEGFFTKQETIEMRFDQLICFCSSSGYLNCIEGLDNDDIKSLSYETYIEFIDRYYDFLKLTLKNVFNIICNTRAELVREQLRIPYLVWKLKEKYLYGK